MPGRKPKYSAQQNAEYKVRALDVLANSQVSLSAEAIMQNDIVLLPLTTQKMTRVLSSLVDIGLVQKCKSKATGKMMYMATAVMEAQGYDI